jgi:hypothetical protein
VIDPETADRIDAEIEAFFAESDAEDLKTRSDAGLGTGLKWAIPPFGAEEQPVDVAASETNGRIHEHHLDMLAKSGITPEFAALRGYETFVNAGSLKALGLAKAARNLVPGLAFPLLHADGSVACWQYRPDNPRVRKGKPAKYEMPWGQRNVIDVPPGVGDWLPDAAYDLWVTEGTKKADCAAIHGLCVVAINGVWGWLSGGVALPDWRDIALRGRRVILAFDSDVMRNPKVGKALRALAGWLKETKGARVEYLHLPDGEDGAKVGLDDYLMTDGHTTKDLWQLVKAEPPGDHQVSGDDNQATKLIALALAKYELGVSPEGKTFAYTDAAPHIALGLRSGKLGLRQRLARDYFRKYKTTCSSSALTDCGNVLDGTAQEQPTTLLHMRVAGDADAVYVDMADDANRVIAITDGTWEIVDTSPYMFRRSELSAPMPEPAWCGDLSKLWGHIHIAVEDRPLLLAVMVDALIQPNTPKPVTSFQAEHGTAKSTSAKRMRTLIDPSTTPLRSPPRNEDTWIVTAAGQWSIALDNLSNMPDWLSDAICRASTGDGDVKRTLYTDDGLSAFSFRRCVILTGLDLGGLNGDLTDRLVPIKLEPINPDDRLTEAELENQWSTDYAVIFAGLLDLAAKVHHMLPTLERTPLPRMADFGRVLMCVDAITGGDGMARYYESARRALSDSALSDSFIARLVEMRYDSQDTPKTAAQILAAVIPSGDAWGAKPVDWPKKARTVTTRLIKSAPALRQMGWQVDNDCGKNHNNTTLWTIKPPIEGGG